MRFLIIAERRYLSQRMPAELVRSLRAEGYSADIICSDDVVCDFRSRVPSFDSYDVAISRDRSLVGLFLLALAEKSGVAVVNSRAAIEAVRNKAEMTAALATAGIPMPQTIVCRSPDQLRSLPASFFPLVLKPNFGDNGKDVQLVSADDIAHMQPCDSTILLAQKYLPNDGSDLKLYVAGDRVWAVRKPNLWSSGKTGHVSPVPVDREMRHLALQCGAALGLEAYGVDTLPSPAGLQVLEVNEFPNYSGIADAPQTVAGLLVDKAQECRRNGKRADRRLPKRVA